MILTYRISSNNSCPLVNHLPQNNLRPQTEIFEIIASLEQSPPPHPSCHLFLFLSPPCQVEVESDPAELITDG